MNRTSATGIKDSYRANGPRIGVNYLPIFGYYRSSAACSLKPSDYRLVALGASEHSR
jgi:hypothetical protein